MGWELFSEFDSEFLIYGCIAVSVLLTIALSSRSPKSFALFLAALIWMMMVDEAEAQTTAQAIPTTERDGLVMPDWSKMNFDSLPAMSEAGSVTFPPEAISALGFDPSTSWQAGAKIPDVVKAGSLQELGVANMSLSDIDKLTGQASQQLPLGSFAPTEMQSIATITDAVPGLGSLTANQAQPIADLIQKHLPQLQDLTGGQFGLNSIKGLDILNTPINQVIQQLPQVGELNLNQLDLSKYAISQIPGLDQAPLGNFKNWEQTFLKGVPGLSKVAFSQFPGMPSMGARALIARVDVPLDQVDQQRSRTVSGSFKAGFQVPCTTNCAHAEISPLAGSQTQEPVNGLQWISGKHQQVPGGNGVLGAVSGGKEPTGRNPYGGIFKQVITKIDQKKGQVETSLYMRVCHRHLGCTPYFIGPVPFLNYHEKQLIYLGEDKQDDGKGIELAQADPAGDQSGMEDFDPCAAPLTAITGPLIDKAASVSRNPGKAKQYMPLLLGALKQQGITDPAQVAYALATFEHETDGFNTLHEYGREATGAANGYSGGPTWYGRGFVQLTHIENYQKMSKVVGKDLVANPELAADPAIAAQISAYGMKHGSFTGAKLSDFIGGGRADFYNARTIINGHDRAGELADIARQYYSAIKDVSLAQASTIADSNKNSPNPNDACSGAGGDKWYDPLPGAIETAPFAQAPHHGHAVHAGIDISTGSSGKVHAARDGVVVDAEHNCSVGDFSCGGGYGNLIVIQHKGYMTLYGHNSQVFVNAGQSVKGGQVIAIEGTTGASTGPHSHFELRRGSSSAMGFYSLSPTAPGKMGVPHSPTPFSNVCAGNYQSQSYCGHDSPFN